MTRPPLLGRRSTEHLGGGAAPSAIVQSIGTLAMPVLLGSGYLVVLLNVEAVFGIKGGNAVEKALFLAAALASAMTRRLDPFILVAMGLVVGCCVSLGILTPYAGFSWPIAINAFNQILIVYLLLATYPTIRDADLILKCYSLLPLLCVGLGCVYLVTGLDDLTAAEFASGLQRLKGSSESAAYLSALAMCGVYAAVLLALQGRKTTLLALCNFVVLLAAGGRAALAATLLLCVASLAASPAISLARKLRAGGAAGLVGLVVLALFWERMMTRVENSGDNGREVIWSFLTAVGDKYAATGIGFGHQYFIVPEEITKYISSAAAHNDFIRLYVELGAFGYLFFYLVLSAVVVRIALRAGNPFRSPVLYAYAGFLLMSRSDNAFASTVEWVLILIAMLAQTIDAGSPAPIRSEPSDRRTIRRFGRTPLGQPNWGVRA